VKNVALYSRGALSALMVVVGCVVLVRLVPLAHAGIVALLPGAALGAAMIALGVHRLSLIARIRRSP